MQTEEIRCFIKTRYLEKDLFTVTQDFPTDTDHRLTNSRAEMTVRNVS